ncbi:adenosine deaminase [Thermoplasmatales archaeon SG8-52-4]|nr:MAG: adenosine deaminase [Thermoplasmatales archaeon SG8-52-4]
MDKEISGNIVNIFDKVTFPGTLKIDKGVITKITKKNKDFNNFIIPGFVDAHVHIESSMLTPSEFARIAVAHGTVAIVSDPHEIANVLGINGVYYMLKDASKVPLKICFGAPSCVPASPFESAGNKLNEKDIEELLSNPKIGFLAEVMNYPGVINNDPELITKINLAKKFSKPIDGHAPGLSGRDLENYISKGISTDHECFTIDEALEKIKMGMKILIREGSAARDFSELYPLLDNNWESCMLCSDDKHPDDLVNGHINLLVKKAIEKEIDPFKIFSAASLNPVNHYNLGLGLLRVGDPADFLVIDNLKDLNILRTYINGVLVAKNGKSNIKRTEPEIKNNFNIGLKKQNDFIIEAKKGKINVINAIEGQIITEKSKEDPKISEGQVISDIQMDILKITVVNRYNEVKPSIGFIKNFGLKEGAIASSVAHDSHNIIAIGVNDNDICKAVNLIIKNKGGICAIGKGKENILPLPIAGIISNKKYDWIAEKYVELNNMAKTLGCNLKAPFMTLSFMALPVIPKLKLSDKGLFDSEKFKFINIFDQA